MTLDELFQIAPYSLSKAEKDETLKDILNDLTRRHYAACPEYARILDALKFDAAKNHDCADFNSSYAHICVATCQALVRTDRQRDCLANNCTI